MTGKVIPLQQTYSEQRPDQVTTFDRLSSYNIGKRINPDDLVGTRGLRIYAKMCADEQVKAVLNFKRDAITARGWQFCFPKTTSLSEDEQEARIHLFETIITKMRGSFSDALNAIMTGRAFGFSIVEKVYGTVEMDGKEWPGINMLLGRDPNSFYFYTDDYGVVNKIEQQTPRSGLVEVDRQRIIHYVHAPEWDHVFGRSDLREAYRSWYIKDQTLRLWPTYLERFAGGFVHAELGPETSLSTQELDSLDEALANAKSIGAIRTPPGVKLNVIQPPGNAEVYKTAIEFHDLAIAKALLVPNLLGISHTGQTGAFAQSQTQLTAFYWTLNADASRLEECLNEQLFRDLGDQAWGDGEYPRFQFKPASMDHVKWVVETWLAMLDKGAALATIADEAFLRKLLDLPPREEEDKTIAEDQQERAPAPPPMAPGAAPPGGDPAQQGQQSAAEQEDDGEEEDTPPKKKEDMARRYTPPAGGGCIHEGCNGILAFSGPRGSACPEHWREVMSWDESQHPRDERGRFGEAGGGGDKVDPKLNPEVGDKTPTSGPAFTLTVDHGGDPENVNTDDLDHDAITEQLGYELVDVYDIPKEYAKYIEVSSPEYQDKDSEVVYYSVATEMPQWLASLIEKRTGRMARRKLLRAKMSWDESQHPRDKDGKFGDGAGGPDPSGMSAGQINKELDKLDKESTRINEELIAAGRGSERPSDMRGKTDPLSKRFWDNVNRRAALRDEITARYGPGAPSRLPRGFGPRARLSRSEPTTVTTKRRYFYVQFADQKTRDAFARRLMPGASFQVNGVAAFMFDEGDGAPKDPHVRFCMDTELNMVPGETSFVVISWDKEEGFEVVLAP